MGIDLSAPNTVINYFVSSAFCNKIKNVEWFCDRTTERRPFFATKLLVRNWVFNITRKEHQALHCLKPDRCHHHVWCDKGCVACLNLFTRQNSGKDWQLGFVLFLPQTLTQEKQLWQNNQFLWSINFHATGPRYLGVRVFGSQSYRLFTALHPSYQPISEWSCLHSPMTPHSL